jgi:hypothetical protein
MGCTNYWSWNTPQADESKFAAWSRDVRQLIGYLTTPGRALPGYIYLFDPPDRAKGPYNICGPGRTGEPEVTSKWSLSMELQALRTTMSRSSSGCKAWYYSICCMLRNLSGRVFPATPEEHQQLKAEYRCWQERYDREQTRTHDA